MAAATAPINSTVTHTPTAAVGQHSPWHSPVPYLFGGLAAMLGLIAFALLILACSYWKLSGYLDNGGNEGGERDLEAGGVNETGNGDKQGLPSLVIMPGEKKPMFVATPMSSRSSSFGDTGSTSSSEKRCSCGEKSEKLENDSIGVEMVKRENTDNQHQRGHDGAMGSNESLNQNH